jgi:hypothetical protein
MARLRDRSRLDPKRLAAMGLELMIGPVAGYGPTVDDLALAWELQGEEVMSDYHGAPGTRPWAYWTFDLDQPQPSGWDAEAVRLAILGLLEPGELAALRERANEARLRVGTDRERISGGNRESGVSVDAAAVEVWERVSAVWR